jgi:hypothetical protein
MIEKMGITHGAEVKQGRIPVGLLDSFHFTGDRVQGFVPGNPGEFTRATLPVSFQGVKKPVGGIDPLTIGMASQAHTGTSMLIRNGLNPYDLSLPDMHLEIAGPPAMAVADSMNNPFFVVVLFCAHQILLGLGGM